MRQGVWVAHNLVHYEGNTRYKYMNNIIKKHTQKILNDFLTDVMAFIFNVYEWLLFNLCGTKFVSLHSLQSIKILLKHNSWT